MDRSTIHVSPSAVVLAAAIALAACGSAAPAGPSSETSAIPAASLVDATSGTTASKVASPAVSGEPDPATTIPLTFDEFYDGYDVRTGLKLSEKLRSLDGQRVRIEGYMAPPLKPELDFFVLTRIRLAYCPFCSTAGDWPDDIAVIYLVNSTMRTTERPLRLEGTIELGQEMDPETGMLSLVRIYADRVELL
jgi:hypothetical protein